MVAGTSFDSISNRITIMPGNKRIRYHMTRREKEQRRIMGIVNSMNMSDFGARWYDVAGVPMWTSVDPLSEKYYNVSPYAYCAGDPVNRYDQDGRDIWEINEQGLMQ